MYEELLDHELFFKHDEARKPHLPTITIVVAQKTPVTPPHNNNRCYANNAANNQQWRSQPSLHGKINHNHNLVATYIASFVIVSITLPKFVVLSCTTICNPKRILPVALINKKPLRLLIVEQLITFVWWSEFSYCTWLTWSGRDSNGK